MQPLAIEVWSEKGTVRGTLQPVLREFGVTFRVMHGYSSATTLHEWICSHDTGHMWEASSPQPVLAGLMRL